MRNISTFDVLNFYNDFPVFIRESDNREAMRLMRKMAIIQLTGFGLGIFANVKLKSIYPQILKMPVMQRMGTRLIVFSFPPWLAYQLFAKSERNKLNHLIDKVHSSLVTLGTDGDAYKYFS